MEHIPTSLTGKSPYDAWKSIYIYNYTCSTCVKRFCHMLLYTMFNILHFYLLKETTLKIKEAFVTHS
jgi:hypothetical protein